MFRNWAVFARRAPKAKLLGVRRAKDGTIRPGRGAESCDSSPSSDWRPYAATCAFSGFRRGSRAWAYAGGSDSRNAINPVTVTPLALSFPPSRTGFVSQIDQLLREAPVCFGDSISMPNCWRDHFGTLQHAVIDLGSELQKINFCLVLLRLDPTFRPISAPQT